jgi:integral membrane protein
MAGNGHKALSIFRKIGMLEGASFLILLGIAMPLKYFAGMPMAVTIVGALHGLLFVLYLLAIIYATISLRWKFGRVLGAFLAAFLPFGPFVFDARLRKNPF